MVSISQKLHGPVAFIDERKTTMSISSLNVKRFREINTSIIKNKLINPFQYRNCC